MFQRGWFHIDVRRQELLPDLLGVVRQYGPARVKPLSTEVVSELAGDRRFAGLIVQLGSEGMPLLERLFVHAPALPVLALLEHGERGLINHLQARGVSTLVLPLQLANTVTFVQRALTQNFVPCARVGNLIAHLAERRMLTAREVQLVSYCLGDEPRALVRRRLGITENTLKSQIRGLLRKCGERNLDSLAKNLLRSALMPTGAPNLVAASVALHELEALEACGGPLHEREPEGAPAVSGPSEVTRPQLRLYRSGGQVSATQH
jgi:DNA-binding NarL/FixJ family response regulator